MQNIKEISDNVNPIYISKLVFNDRSKVEIANNDIIVFVGPNNVGKSQSLRDIYNLAGNAINTVVVKNFEMHKDENAISNILRSNTTILNTGSDSTESFSFMGRHYNINPFFGQVLNNSVGLGEYRDVLVDNLNTQARLTICNPPQSIERKAYKKHPIHYAAFNQDNRGWLSDNFKKAFNKDLIPNTQNGSTIPLCVGDNVRLSGTYDDEQERLEAYASLLERYDQVQEQGDGIKSFTGILLHLMLTNYHIYLIDEPESFLHPPQANIMGEIIGRALENRQAFISTHSEDIIKGLLSVCPERIKIIRITRQDKINRFSILENIKFNNVWNDPLLRYSNIMQSLFLDSVALCESDSDCKLYGIILSHLLEKK